ACRHIVSAQVIVQRAGQERDSTCRQNRSAQIWNPHLEWQWQWRTIAHRTVLAHPHHVSRRQIRRGDIAPWWLLTWQPKRGCEGAKLHREWCAKIFVQRGKTVLWPLIALNVERGVILARNQRGYK